MLGVAAVCASGQKLSREVVERAATLPGGERIPVFIVLNEQPTRVSRGNRERFRAEQQSLMSTLVASGATRTGAYEAINMVTAEVPVSMLPVLEQDPSVAQVFAVGKRYASDLSLSVPATGAPAFWNAGRTGAGASVALVDTGVQTAHPAFAGRNIVSRTFLTYGSQSACFDDDASTTVDRQGHGTHVAGILISQGAPGYANYIGMARGLSTLFNLKTAYKGKPPCINVNGEIDDRDLIAALEWAALNTPSKIINLSFGAPANGDGDDFFTRAVDFIADVYDAFIAVAAGNTGPARSTVQTPAIGYNVTGVANWDFLQTGKVIANSSSRGPTIENRFKPDIAAPGVGIASANFAGTDYVVKSGTSMATPHVAGAAALLASSGVTDPLQMKAILLNTTGDVSWLADRGWGVMDLAAAQPQVAFRDSVLLQKGEYQFYRVPASAAPLSATITWNRHLDGPSFNIRFNNLDLLAYNLTTGAALAASTSISQNVEKISVPGGNADLVVKVDTVAPNPSLEFYGIAMSRFFTRASGPVLTAVCSPPASAFAGVPFAVPCTVTNRGDLPLIAVNVAGVNAGTIAPGASATVSPSFTGSSTGTGAFTADTTSNSYGELFSTSVNFTVSLVPPPPPPAAVTQALPADGAAGVPLTNTLTWTAAAGATSYDVYFGAATPPPFLANTSLLTLTPPQLTSSVRYFWRVVARNAGGTTASPVWSFTTAPSTGLRFVPITPCRIVIDSLEAQQFQDVDVRTCLPDGVTPGAYSLQVTVEPEGPLGFLTLGSASVATLTSLDGRVRTNSAIVSAVRLYTTDRTKVTLDINGYFASEGLVYYPLPAPCRGTRCAFPDNAAAWAINTTSPEGSLFSITTTAPSADTADVYGYFAPAGNPGALTLRTKDPCRLLDTRDEDRPLVANATRDIPPAKTSCSAEGGVAVVNVTAVPDGPLDALSLWRTGQPKPQASVLTSPDGSITSNAALVPSPFSAASTNDGVHLILDLFGVFLP